MIVARTVQLPPSQQVNTSSTACEGRGAWQGALREYSRVLMQVLPARQGVHPSRPQAGEPPGRPQLQRQGRKQAATHAHKQTNEQTHNARNHAYENNVDVEANARACKPATAQTNKQPENQPRRRAQRSTRTKKHTKKEAHEHATGGHRSSAGPRALAELGLAQAIYSAGYEYIYIRGTYIYSAGYV